MKVIWKFGNDISTDHIYPGRYMATVLPTETPQYAFADIPELNKLLNEEGTKTTKLIVAGENFGTGSSREQAVSALVGCNVIVIAKSFARIFFQNSINLGLKTVICPEIDAEVGDELEITDLKVINRTKNKEYSTVPIPTARKKIVDAGGLISYTRMRLVNK
ncbi:3-isopropylmalate dehydratase [bacterium]|nr:3-isopropylmalate dehydratase [bacterium]